MRADVLIRKCAQVGVAGLHTTLGLVERRVPDGSRAKAGVQTVRHLLGTAAGGGRTPAHRASAQSRAATSMYDEAAEREAIAESVRERQPDVGELADPDLDVAEVQAELQAKHAVEERQQRRGRGR